jgi:hypothetical protein
MPIGRIEQIKKGTWLFFPYELSIKKIIFYYDLRTYNDLLIFITSEMDPFPVYSDKDGDYQEAALFENKTYITRKEYDNGYAEINNVVYPLSEHKNELRIRYLKSCTFLLVPNRSNWSNYHSEKEVEKLLKDILIEANNNIIIEHIENAMKKIFYNYHEDVEITL